jgi:S1-C subfamily serine protease
MNNENEPVDEGVADGQPTNHDQPIGNDAPTEIIATPAGEPAYLGMAPPTDPAWPTVEQAAAQQRAQQTSEQPLHPKARKPIFAIAIATAAVLCIGGLGTAGIAILTRPATSTTSTTTTPNANGFDRFGPGGSQFPGLNGQSNGSGSTSNGGSSNIGGTTVSAPTASTASEKAGVVTINTVLDYDSSQQAAGTGMILSSDGLILTNNHVVQQSTTIKVTVESTNKTYTAVVVGTDKTADVAVLKLVGASGLTPVTLDTTDKVAVGDAIKSVGNAEGTGDLVTASGTVGAVDQKLTVSSDFSSSGESLSGLIELNSDVVSGDSGGPLFDKNGEVVGIVTAASSGSATVTGYAINIAAVMDVVTRIEAGEASSNIVIGYPAFLGVGIATTTSVTGVPVGSIFAGTPAAKAGITAGSVITRVDGATVSSADALSAKIAAHKVGDTISVTWTTARGVSHTAAVTLVGGPAA